MGRRRKAKAKPSEAGGRSLVGQRTMGGIHGGRGYKVQTRYIALQVARWLRDPAFRTVQPEGLEDLDVYFEINGAYVRDHYQVKSQDLDRLLLKEIVKSFGRELSRGARRLVLASPHASSEVRRLFDIVERFRNVVFPDPDPDGIRIKTERDLTSRFKRLGLTEQQPLILKHVFLDPDFASLAVNDEAAIARIVGEIGHLDRFNRLPPDSMRVAATTLLDLIDGALTRDAVLAAIEQAVARHNRGPATSAGDVLVVQHQSFAPVGQPLESASLPHGYENRRRVHVLLDSVGACRGGASNWIEDACRLVAGEGGPLRQGLDRHPDAPVVYYGFPHVPLGVLAGAVIGPQRLVHVLEHDRESGLFTWPGGIIVPMSDPLVRRSEGHIAILRLSVSASVLPDVSMPRDGRVGLELGVTVDRVGRGVVTSEASAREIVKVVRALLDEHVAGRGYASLHVYAAIPVSVAVLLGRALAASALPRIYVYNFNQMQVPPYHWRLCVQDALADHPAVENLTDGRGA